MIQIGVVEKWSDCILAQRRPTVCSKFSGRNANRWITAITFWIVKNDPDCTLADIPEVRNRNGLPRAYCDKVDDSLWCCAI